MRTPFAGQPGLRRRSILFVLATAFAVSSDLSVASSSAAAAAPAASARQHFDVPAGDARTMLRRFASQARREIIFPVDNVAGVTTNAVKGEYSPSQALEQMLVDTGLVASFDPKTGAIAVRRQAEPKPKNEVRAAPAASSDRPTATRSRAAFTRADAAADDETVQLSPFEVVADTRGYYAANTLSGTRINTKLEDLAASVSVVTKQQMSDFALLDLHDVFNYETNTEGMGNYTAFTVDQEGNISDQLQNSPETANRVRGIGPANMALDSFATSGRVPVDPIDIDAIEISRGPNSNIFGLGEGSGTVNMVSSSANLRSVKATAEARVDDRGGWRTSLDINRPIIPGKLAVRASSVYQHEAWRQKPSGFETRRFNFMVRAQPFERTSVRASFKSYHGVGTRPNTMMPRDSITYWKSLGSPTWDPTTSTVTVNGASTYYPGVTLPPGLEHQDVSLPNMFVDRDGIRMWRISRMPVPNTAIGPLSTGGTQRMLETTNEPVNDAGPLFSSRPGLSDTSIYDWEHINLAAPNTMKDQIETSFVTLEHTFLDTERHKLGLQLAWQREDGDRLRRNFVGQSAPAGGTFALYVDPNEKLMNGEPNPFFLRPYLGLAEPALWDQPFSRDSYRGQVAYVLDFSSANGWARWFGRHQLVGYQEERKNKSFGYRYRDVMTSDHPLYAPPGQPKGNQTTPIAPVATRLYWHFYVGDNQGQNIDYAPSGYELGNYTFNWYDARANRWVADPATLGRAATTGGGGTLNVIKTRGGVLQSSFLQNRVVATAGMRVDDDFTRRGKPAVLKPNGWEFDWAAIDGWEDEWATRNGKTETRGLIVRPFRGSTFMNERRSVDGLLGFGAEVLAGLQVHYNESNSFRPATPALNMWSQDVPNPSSEQEEYGFSLSLWDNKLILRANRYETRQINSRNGPAASVARLAMRVDYNPFQGSTTAISLQRQAQGWVAADHPDWSAQQIEDEVYRIMGLTAEESRIREENPLTETNDVIAEGDEYEVHFNPTNTWTLRLNATKQSTTYANISPNIGAWVEKRLPLWRSVIDTRTNTPWFTNTYSGVVPQNWLNSSVLERLKLAQAMEGKRNSQGREWRINLSTSYRLANLTENKHLRRMNVGGAVRWQSKGTIGYYGIPVNGDIYAATSYDPNRPIYDKARANIDVFAGYSVRLFREKVRARFQLNVRNLEESGRIQAVAAYPDGRPYNFRIIDPRLFIFTTTFEL